jgi:glucose/arabinose dehydrogenase
MRLRRATTILLLVAGSLVSTVTPTAAEVTLRSVPVVTGLAYPAMFTVAPDGRIFFSELHTGRIRIATPGAATSPPVFLQVPDLCTSADQGLFGLALHPDYPAQPLLYAYATRLVAGVCETQVLRIKEVSPSQGWPHDRAVPRALHG